MAFAKYKVHKPFEQDDFQYGIGMVLVLDPKKATDLVESGKIVMQKYLDPEDATDAAEIKHWENNPTGQPKRGEPVAAAVAANEGEDAADEDADADKADESEDKPAKKSRAASKD